MGPMVARAPTDLWDWRSSNVREGLQKKSALQCAVLRLMS